MLYESNRSHFCSKAEMALITDPLPPTNDTVLTAKMPQVASSKAYGSCFSCFWWRQD